MADKKARDIMSPDCKCIGENDSVLDAAKCLAALDVGSMPICGEDDRLKGMLTDRDIVVKVIAKGKDPSGVTSVRVALEINGARHELELDERVTLVDALRIQLGMPGTKMGCDHGQCGYCTPGQIMSAAREQMSGNLCRCGAYPNIVAATADVRGQIAGVACEARAMASVQPDPAVTEEYAISSFGAHFCEVRIDPLLPRG